MSDAGKSAVFLSYASQDAEAARRICEALRAQGVEMWFDQNELVGGDAWDAKIRKQISECALFVPIISAATQARREGYFRLEWKLAAQRTHMIADGTPFLLPVVIDVTRDAEALVPAEFKAVQWTRLPGGETTTKFRGQIGKLLGGEFSAAPPAPAVERPKSVTRQASQTPRLVVAGCGLALAIVLAIWQPWKKASPSRTTPSQATELAGLRARIVPERWGSADYEVMRPALDRWIQSHPDDSDAMALRSCISSLQVLRTLDFGTKVLSEGKADAERASRLAPGSPLAELAHSFHHVAMMTRGGEAEAARPHLERALAALPQDILARYAQMAYFAFSLQLDRVRQAADAWLLADPAATFPRWCVAYSALIERKAEEAEKWAERGVSDGEAATTVRSLSTLFEINFFLRANLRAARETLERVPATARSHHRLVYARWFLALAGRQWDEAIQELARVPDALLLDRCFRGPKSLLAGIAHHKAGRAAPAAAQFREAERMLRELLASDADNEDLRLALALALAYQGRADDARSELGAVEPLLRGRKPYLYSGHAREMIAETYAVIGDVEGTLPWLRQLFAESSAVPYTPASFRLDVRFDGILQDPRVQALLAESAPRETTAADPKSVAVLPFANHSGDPAQDYVSDGLTVEIQTALSNERDLRVSGATSAFAFKGRAVPVPEIARALNVAQVVEGSVRKSGNQVRITVALTRASDGFSEPLGTFTEKLDDLFALQEKAKPKGSCVNY
jgi:TolB-like protein